MTKASIPDVVVGKAVHVHLQLTSIVPVDARHEEIPSNLEWKEGGVALGVKMLAMSEYESLDLVWRKPELIILAFENLPEGSGLDQLVNVNQCF